MNGPKMERPKFTHSCTPSLAPLSQAMRPMFNLTANSIFATSFRDCAECQNVVVRDADVGEKRLGRVA